jgi:uncharacterized MAPEG superfamily protein
MSTATPIAIEFWWLALTGVLMLVMSLPYVTDRIITAGFGNALGNPQNNKIPHSGWAERLKAAHSNTVENMVVFGPLTIAVVVAGVASEMTAMAAAAFFVSRVVYVVVYMFGIPLLRTLAFLVGWLSSLVMAGALLGYL